MNDDTPRTNAQETQIYSEDVTGCSGSTGYVPASFARELERENARLRGALEKVRERAAEHTDAAEAEYGAGLNDALRM